MNPVTCVMTILMMLAVMTAADPVRSYQRVKRQYDLPGSSSSSASDSDPCDPMYARMYPTHTLCLPIDPTAQLVPLNDSMISYIVTQHNYYRANIDPPAADMLKLVWDEKLARTARRVAMRCVFEHDENRREPDWRGLEIGQNLASGHVNWTMALYRLFSEPERANYSYGDKYTDAIGHWYQMAYHAANRIGCAQAFCPNTKFKHLRVCNYAARMNVGQFDELPPYAKAAEPCSSCKQNCENNLCNCGGKLCLNGGTLNPGDCTCSCESRWKGANCSEIDCSVNDQMNSCKDGRLTIANCSQPGTVVHDPYMCPHMCEICPACNGKQCSNGGTLDKKKCTCSCPSSHTGSLCETACSSLPCQNGGTPNAQKCKCDCTVQWYGLLCENQCPTCANNGIQTKDSNGNCGCSCTGGYFGPQCKESCKDKPEAAKAGICAAAAAAGLCSFDAIKNDCKKTCGAC